MSFDPFSADFPPACDWREVDYAYRLPDDERLLRFAEFIEQAHRGQHDATKSWRSIDNRVLGLKGERAFARIFGCQMDLRIKRFGNFRRNFELRNGAKVDVVTRRMLYGSTIYPDLTIRHRANSRSRLLLYLIVWATDDREPFHAGWITEQEAHRVGRVEQFKEGIVNTVVDIGQLNDPRQLLREHRPDSEYLITSRDTTGETQGALFENVL